MVYQLIESMEASFFLGKSFSRILRNTEVIESTLVHLFNNLSRVYKVNSKSSHEKKDYISMDRIRRNIGNATFDLL